MTETDDLTMNGVLSNNTNIIIIIIIIINYELYLRYA